MEVLSALTELDSGTAVLWRKLDRVVDHSEAYGHDPETAFLRRFLYVKGYLEMVFHQFLEDRSKGINIFVGAARCEPWDPFLVSNPLPSGAFDGEI